jgi:hypothetical protein
MHRILRLKKEHNSNPSSKDFERNTSILDRCKKIDKRKKKRVNYKWSINFKKTKRSEMKLKNVRN